MQITNEYRWNVPVVTYGFDQSFLDYFGTNGVAAVERAIQILNDLPPASQIVLTNYPFGSTQINYQAQALGLLDLKSETLSLLLQQMGLAQPWVNVYVLSDWNPNYFNDPPPNSYIEILGIPIFFEGDDSGLDPGASGYYPIYTPGHVTNFVAGFNFDPESLEPSVLINNILYTGEITFPNSSERYINIFPLDPLKSPFPTIAGASLDPGMFYTGLTYDDIGGLAYLLSTNNINYEPLLSDVSGIGTNANSYVNGAWRPGVDKITFVPQAVEAVTGAFLPMTNQFIDTCITNGNEIRQQLQRITMQPDFLFSAGKDQFCTGTTNWINNADLNNNPIGAGPGIIQPPANIVFQKIGRNFYSAYSYTIQAIWSEDSVQDVTAGFGTYGTFDESTNAPIAFPTQQTGDVSMAVRVLLRHSNYPPTSFQSFEWHPTSQAGSVYALQTSTNLSTWNTLFVVTNNGSVSTYQNVNANSFARFYRLIPK